MEYKYGEGLYYGYNLDTFKDLKVVVQYAVDIIGDLENGLIDEFNEGYYIVKGKLDDYENWEIGEQGENLINKLKLSKIQLIDKILNYNKAEYTAIVGRDERVKVKDSEFEVVVFDVAEWTIDGISTEMVNVGELIKYYYYDEDGDGAVVIFCHYHYNGSLERLEKNLSE